MKLWTQVIVVLGILMSIGCGHLESQGDVEFEESTVVLEQPIHFLGKDGEDILVTPGTYQVKQAGETLLRLIPDHQSSKEPTVIVQALSSPHDQVIHDPLALVISEGEDEQHVVLLLPSKEGLDAQGSQSGIRSRAARVLPRGRIQQSVKRYRARRPLVRQSSTVIVKPPPSTTQQAEPVYAPTITSMTPSSGVWDSRVTLTGQNLNGGTVHLLWRKLPDGSYAQNVSAYVQSSTSMKLTFQVPAYTGGDIGEPVFVKVTTPKGSIISASPFQPDRLAKVTGATLLTGTPGTRVKVLGYNLERATQVRFGADAVPGILVSAAFNHVTVDLQNCHGSGPIIVHVAPVPNLGIPQADYITSPQVFTCGALPVITNVSPLQVAMNGQVSIQGSGLAGATEIKIPSLSPITLPAQGVNVYDQSITFFVPAHSSANPLTGVVRVTTPFGIATSSQSLTVRSATILNQMMPPYGEPNSFVTFYGKNFHNGGIYPQVFFNGIQSPFISNLSNTALSAKVPEGASSGFVWIKTLNNETPHDKFEYVVGAPGSPTVTSIVPASGPPGTKITIQGTNLIGVGTVQFTGGAQGGKSNDDPNRSQTIKVSVPAQAQTGPLTIRTSSGCPGHSLCSEGQSLVTTQIFTVAP